MALVCEQSSLFGAAKSLKFTVSALPKLLIAFRRLSSGNGSGPRIVGGPPAYPAR
jgi:hypothetical protein